MRRMWSIPHLSKASVTEITRLFHTPNIVATEKIDGCNISFGIVNDVPYVKSKKGEYATDSRTFSVLADRFPDTSDVQNGFIDVLEHLQNKTDALKRFCNKYPGIQIFGELLHCERPNIISYNKYTKNGPVVFVFDVRIDNKSNNKLLNSLELRRFLKKLSGRITFAVVPRLCDPAGEKLQMEWGLFSSMYPDIHCKKRLPVYVERKNICKAAMSKWLTNLSKHIRSNYSDDIEGVVLRNLDTDQFVKVVDLEKFAEIRANEWCGVSEVKGVRRDLYKDLLSTVFRSADILLVPEKQAQKVIESCEHCDDIIQIIYQDIRDEVGNFYCEGIVELLDNAIVKFKNVSGGDKADSYADTEVSVLETIKNMFNTSEYAGIHALIEYMLGSVRVTELNKLIRKVG